MCAAAEGDAYGVALEVGDADGVALEVGDAPSTGKASPGASWYAAFLAAAICLSMDWLSRGLITPTIPFFILLSVICTLNNSFTITYRRA